MQQQPALPVPDSDSRAHEVRVAAHLRECMSEGAIGFARFMHEALYAPGLGYYTAGASKLGEAGDFVTAPEVSPLFGRVLARQVAEALQRQGGGDILEVGAGSGRLAVDLLQSLKDRGALPHRYLIIEVSADLARRQQELLQTSLPDLLPRIEWLSAWPADFAGVVVANEVLDALPVERFVKRGENVWQLCVEHGDAGFVWTERPAPPPLVAAVDAVEVELGEALTDGFVSEVSLAIPAWIASMAACLKRAVVFLFDYGISRREYYAADRADGWLRCHFRHHAHNNPLVLTGIQDLTAWVDFTAVASAATASGLDVLGYAPQAQFLFGAGLEAETAALADAPLQRQVALSGQIKTLTLPGEMGEHFKCLALGQGDVTPPSAFDFADRTHTL